MPFDGSGNYTPAAAPNFPAIGGTTISAAYYNAVINDIAAALSNTLTRDGQGKPATDFDWNNKNLSGVKDLGVTNLTVSGSTTLANLVMSTLTAASATIGAASAGVKVNIIGNSATDFSRWTVGTTILAIGGTDGSGMVLNASQGGSAKLLSLQTNGGGVALGGVLTTVGSVSPGNVANFYISGTATNATFNFDSNDYLDYNRSTNTLTVAIGGSAVMTVTAGTATFAGNVVLGTAGTTAAGSIGYSGGSLTFGNGSAALTVVTTTGTQTLTNKTLTSPAITTPAITNGAATGLTLTSATISSLSAALAVAYGGTGGATAADARTNLGVLGAAGQSWAATSLSVGVSYQNTTGRPIQVVLQADGYGYFQVSSDNSFWVTLIQLRFYGSAAPVIPAGHYYRYTGPLDAGFLYAAILS